MRYLSVCSGIEAATVAWNGLGWTPVAFSEIEPFPSAVLAHHYPHVPNVGDMTNFKEWNLGSVDLLVGGTPCQSFSVAGLRKGLDDPRGNLMLTFLAIAERHRPRWIVWENVPGVLSSNGGRDFGTFLGALGELGYGWAYRVLDAQWFGVAQRRRRVFVVGCLGDQSSAAAVLFESEGVCRNPAPSRETRQGVARGVGGGPADGSIAGAVTRKWAKGSGGPAGDECYNMVAQPVAGSHWDSPANPHPTLNQSAKGSGGIAASDQELFSQRGSGLVPQPVSQPVAFHPTQDPISSVDGTTHAMGCGSKQGTATVAVAYGTDCYNGAITGDVAATIGTPGSSVNASGPTVMQPVAFSRNDDGGDATEDCAPTMRVAGRAGGMLGVAQSVGSFKPGQSAAARSIGYEADLAPSLEGGGGGNNKPAVHVAMQVRRLTPVECERLQGFPDGYTNIPWRKKPESPDGPRYKALGNSMAVPCMRWIGERIQSVSSRDEKLQT